MQGCQIITKPVRGSISREVATQESWQIAVSTVLTNTANEMKQDTGRSTTNHLLLYTHHSYRGSTNVWNDYTWRLYHFGASSSHQNAVEQ